MIKGDGDKRFMKLSPEDIRPLRCLLCEKKLVYMASEGIEVTHPFLEISSSNKTYGIDNEERSIDWSEEDDILEEYCCQVCWHKLIEESATLRKAIIKHHPFHL